MNTRTKQLVTALVAIVVVGGVALGILYVTGWIGGNATTYQIGNCTIKGGGACPGANLSGQTLNQGDFARGDWHGANFSNSSMANLSGRNANFQGANFYNASIGGSAGTIEGADFSNANFCNAIMTDVKGSYTDTGANYCNTTLPNGTKRSDPGCHCP